ESLLKLKGEYVGRKNSHKKRLVFFSENIIHYFPENAINEITVLEELIRGIEISEDIQISIRPHPMESKSHWIQFIQRMTAATGKIKLNLDTFESVYDSIMHADVTVGISSMALIESSILGIPSFSYQCGMSDCPEM